MWPLLKLHFGVFTTHTKVAFVRKASKKTI